MLIRATQLVDTEVRWTYEASSARVDKCKSAGAASEVLLMGVELPVEIKDRASVYVPAIGKVAITMLLPNLLRIVRYQQLREVYLREEANG